MRPRQCYAHAWLFLLCCGVAGPALSQSAATPDVETPWVQVEVIAFRHMGSGGTDEKWPASPALSYPPDLRFLLEPGSPEHIAALEAREFERALQAEAGSAAPVASATPQTTPQAPDELPGVLLQGPETVLAEAAARIANAPGYRLLAHLAWREPRIGEGSSKHVLVTGGASQGEHRELEGSIAITRSRFLHLDAQLWLNDFAQPGELPGEDAVDLPPLPKPVVPRPPQAMPEAPGLVPEEGVEPVSAEMPVSVEPLRARRTVLLRANRRIALGEVHYLDHPLLGLIVTVRPWDPAKPVAPLDEAPTGNSPAGMPAAPATPPPAQPVR